LVDEGILEAKVEVSIYEEENLEALVCDLVVTGMLVYK